MLCGVFLVFIAPTVMTCGLFPGESNVAISVSAQVTRGGTTTIPCFQAFHRLA